MEDLAETISELVKAPTWSAIADLVEAHPDLLDEGSKSLLDRIIHSPNIDEFTMSQLEDYQNMFSTCDSSSIEQIRDRKGLHWFEAHKLFGDSVAHALSLFNAYQQRGDVGLLDQSMELWRSIEQHPDFNSVPTGYRLYVFDGLSTTQLARYYALGLPDDLQAALGHIRRSVELTARNARLRPRRLTNLSGALAHQFKHAHNLVDIESAVAAAREAVELTSVADPLWPGRVNNLAGALSTKAEFTHSIADLDEALKAYDDAINAAPPNTPNVARLYHGKGSNLRQRYQRDDRVETLNQAIAAFEAAVSNSSPGLPERSLFLGDLGMALGIRFEEQGDQQDLDRAIELLRDALDLETGGQELQRTQAGALGIAYRTRYERNQMQQDLRDASLAFRQALFLTDPDDPEYPKTLQNYGLSLERLDMAIQEALSEAKESGPLLHEAGLVKLKLYEITSDASIRDKAIELLGEAVQCLEGSERFQCALEEMFALRSKALESNAIEDFDKMLARIDEIHEWANPDEINLIEGNQGLLLVDRYRISKDKNDLDRAIVLLERVIGIENSSASIESIANYITAVTELLDTGDTSRLDKVIAIGLDTVQSKSLSSPPALQVAAVTAENLRRRYEIAGDTNDIDLALSLCLRTTDEGRIRNPAYAPVYNALGWAYRTRYDIDGKLASLDRAKHAYQAAVDLSNQDPVFLTNLGATLRARHAVTRRDADLSEAIRLLEQSVSASVGKLGHDLALVGLANAYASRYDLDNNIESLEKAINCLHESIEIGSERTKLGAHINLGRLLLSRYRRTRDKADLNTVIDTLESVGTTPVPPAAMPNLWLMMAGAYAQRFDEERSEGDRSRALELYRKAFEEGRRYNIQAAMAAVKEWLEWSFAQCAWTETAEIAGQAIELVDELLNITLDVENKSRWLQLVGNIPALAAYALSKIGRFDDAVNAIEGGRARLMSEALELGRKDLARLPAMGYGKLYQRFQVLSEQLRRGDAIADVSASLYLQDQAAETREKASSEFIKVLNEIRSLPAFEGLLAKTSKKQLAQACKLKPLIYLLDTPAGGLALVVFSNSKSEVSVEPVWLPQLGQDELRKRMGVADQNDGNGYVNSFARFRHNPNKYWQSWMDDILTITGWLWNAGFEPLLQALDQKQIDTGVVLIPCGLLSLLPWHAAWHEDVELKRRIYASEQTKICYAPNARSLIRYAEPPAGRQLLIASDPLPTSQQRLPWAKVETKQAAQWWPDDECSIREHEHASVNEVCTLLSTHDIFHFVGHAFADVTDPQQSGLYLANDEVLTVAHIVELDINLQLAILSGCETAVPGFELMNELIGLPTAMVQAGTRGVVGSLWLVADQSAALLMGNFHRLWRTEGMSPAAALHEAQRDLREQGYEHPFYWAAFAFTGME